MEQSTFSWEEPPASRSASPECERDWQTTVATWPSNFAAFLTAKSPVGSFGRMSPASCRRMEDGTLEPSSAGWQSAGMGSPTEFLTLNTSVWHSEGSVCSLSDILETGDLPQRYFLSSRACAGILRRAERRGKVLPPMLKIALEQVIERTKGFEKMMNLEQPDS